MSNPSVVDTTIAKRNPPRWHNPGFGRGYYAPSWKEYEAKPRLYVSYDECNDGRAGSLTAMEHMLFDRYTNPVELYKQLMPQLLKALGLPAGTTARWSQKAGCSCPCSPGFILTTPNGEFARTDFWATIADPQEWERVKPWREASRWLQAKRGTRDILANLAQAKAEGQVKVKLSEVRTYHSPTNEVGAWRVGPQGW